MSTAKKTLEDLSADDDVRLLTSAKPLFEPTSTPSPRNGLKARPAALSKVELKAELKASGRC